MNRFTKTQNITDDQGNVFHLKNHAFRHTKGVELLNNGMNILHVQKWMAHASPEMTLKYTKVLDTTMRKSWEEATKQGIFRIDSNSKKPIKIELGYCMKPIKQPCPTQANRCLSCRNFCTTPEFIPQYEIEIRETKAVIEKGKLLGRQVWVDKNQATLNRLESILDTLKEGRTHHMAGKKGREYVGKERIHGR